jgi:hypothetical protein
VSVDLTAADMSCVWHNVPEPPPAESAVFMSATVAGVTGDGVAFGSHTACSFAPRLGPPALENADFSRE